MKKKNYPVRQKVNVHTYVGAGLWREIGSIAKKRDIPKWHVINELLALALSHKTHIPLSKTRRAK